MSLKYEWSTAKFNMRFQHELWAFYRAGFQTTDFNPFPESGGLIDTVKYVFCDNSPIHRRQKAE